MYCYDTLLNTFSVNLSLSLSLQHGDTSILYILLITYTLTGVKDIISTQRDST